ncbi:PBSX family phage terminase large subunit [Actinotignum sp. GS-2025e]|uniref:PBSX family phage terminase large subunit n=1 Tax=unclassified Actinotignum TaxID=2632702 RepID=UPI003F47C0D9
MAIPSPKQFLSIGQSTGRVNIWEGSIRSGKTYASIIRFLAAIASFNMAGQIVITGKNADSIYRNFFAAIDSEPSLSFLAGAIHHRQGAPTAKILGHRVNIIGANDNRAEARIRGMTVALAYVDEITVIPENYFSQLLGRMSPPGAQLFGTTNPDGPQHWFKVKYLDRMSTEFTNWRRFHFTLDDNPALGEEYKNSIKAEYTGLWYDRFILGLWTAAEGAIYDMWNPDQHVIPWDDLPAMVATYCVGVDYGTTNPTAALSLSLGVDGTLYLTDEWRIDATNRLHNWTDAELSTGLLEWLDTPHTPHGDDPAPRFIIVDPAAASFKAQLFHDGARNVRDADNDVLYGIRTLASLLGTGQLKVADRCQGLITEIPGYVWDTKATQRGDDRPIKADDHSLDAARYAITTTEALWRGHLHPEEHHAATPE